jgi:hypothetical protein
MFKCCSQQRFKPDRQRPIIWVMLERLYGLVKLVLLSTANISASYLKQAVVPAFGALFDEWLQAVTVYFD